MGDLIAAVAARAQRLAQPRAATYVAANRLHEVTIRRPLTEPGFDRNRGAVISHGGDVVYEGSARIRSVTPSGMVDLGDSPEWTADTEVSIPAGADLRVDDIITIGDTALARAGGVVDRQFRVIGVRRGGQLPTGLVLDATTIEPSRETT